MGVAAKFIRVFNSDGGSSDLVLGPEGSVLTSNGTDVAPSFQGPQPGHNLPRGFSYTQPWEKAEADRNGFYDFGMGNFTGEFERTAAVSANGSTARGPAGFTTQSDIPWARRV